MTSREEMRSLNAQLDGLGSNVETFRALFDNMAESAAVMKMLLDDNGDPYDWLVIMVNPAFEGRSGMRAEQVVGRQMSELAPDAEPIWLEKFGQAVLEHRAIGVEGYSKLMGQWLRADVVPVPLPEVFVVILREVADKVEAERDFGESEGRQLALLELSDALSSIQEPMQVLRRGAAMLASHLVADRVQYVAIDDPCSDDVCGTIVASYDGDLPPLSGKQRLSDLGLGPEDRECAVITMAPDVRKGEANPGPRPAYLGARISVPLVRQGRLVAALIVQRRGPNKWTPIEVAMAKEAAERTWDAFERASAMEALIAAKDALERTMEKRTRELSECAARCRALVESSVDGFWWTDAEGRITEANQGLADLLGANVDELIGRHWSEGLDRSCRDDIIRETGIVKSGRSVRFELMHRARDGRQTWIQVNSSPIMDEQGRVNGTIGTFINIDDRKRAEEELKRSNEELQQFAYVASHDLREPLRMVSSYLELLEKRYDGKVLDAKAMEYVHYAVDGALRLQRMIDDLLTYSRIDTRARPFAPVDMNEALAIAMGDLRMMIDESGAEIIHEPLPEVIGDGQQIVILLENLISNAIKFRSAQPPRIEISAGPADGYWLFAVRDNGIGMEPGQTGRLFQMFVRLHSRHEYEGTGIGLAICKKIVERHDGMICVSSRPDMGSVFYFTLPHGGCDEKH